MAQGGTIPTNRTQTVTFYNTTGIIEKEKGIYLSPSFKGETAGREVRDVYLEALYGEAVTDYEYENIPISSWSPEDRTLTVRGNIDDFRLITDEGDCLNYLVITRNVTKNNVTHKHYYGFFITGVAQAGGSSVKLTLEPDTFTNVFYLHNKHVLTAQEVSTTDYEPFNERMKNCHVNRQHYNRVRVETSYTLKIRMSDVTVNPNLEVGNLLQLDFSDHAQTQVEGTIKYVDDRDIDNQILEVWLETHDEEEIGEPDNFSSMTYEGTGYQFDYNLQDIEWVENKKYFPDNLRIFLNQEESFKFKYQYKDKKIPLAISSLFTDSELTLIERTVNFESLSEELKSKILKSSLAYVVLEMKSTELLGYQLAKITGQSDEEDIVGAFINDNGLPRFSPTLFFPFLVVPDIFSKYYEAIQAYRFYGKFPDRTNVWSLGSAYTVLWNLSRNALADFVYSAYVSYDVLIPEEHFEFDFSNHYIVINNIKTGRESGEQGYPTNRAGLYIMGVSDNSPEAIQNKGGAQLYYSSSQDHTLNKPYSCSWVRGFLMLQLSKPYYRSIELDINDEAPDVRNTYFDNVLESEPYSFYSLSYLSYEIPFNRNRYYSMNKIKVRYYNSVNGALKISYVPEYTVEGKQYPYFNEGITFTIPANIPLLSDSYSSYYYQNQAQMKNQFAVNDYNRGTDLLQHFVMSGPNAVGQQAFKRGGYGAIAETINQASQMYNEIIDWSQSKEEIRMNQKAKLADMGAKPDNVKQTGSDIFYDLATSESRVFFNHYTIDKVSYDSIAKFLERFGYQVNLYDTLHVNDRVGWNYIKLNSFDINPSFDIMVGQEQDLMRIFSNGVTLLHDKDFLTTGHNYETILRE